MIFAHASHINSRYENAMNSIEVRKRLDRHIGKRDESKTPNLIQVLEWAEWTYNEIPSKDRYSITFSINVFDDRMVSVGFVVSFVEMFSSSTNDHISMFFRKRHPDQDDPIRAHRTAISIDVDYPTAAAFFAAVRADEHFRFACGYPFEEFLIYNGMRPSDNTPYRS